MASKVQHKVQQKVSDFANWLMDHVPTPKDVDTTFKSVLSLCFIKPQTSKPILKEQVAKSWIKTYDILGLPNTV